LGGYWVHYSAFSGLEDTRRFVVLEVAKVDKKLKMERNQGTRIQGLLTVAEVEREKYREKVADACRLAGTSRPMTPEGRKQYREYCDAGPAWMERIDTAYAAKERQLAANENKVAALIAERDRLQLLIGDFESDLRKAQLLKKQSVPIAVIFFVMALVVFSIKKR
jgi:hypothetical protein